MSLAIPAPKDRRPLALLGALILVGLVLRIAAARGDYWLDEAWSALFARDAGTAGRVFFAINHDNNHYLNTLWLQLVGWGGPPMAGRALSIVCGTATIGMVWLIGARRGVIAAAIGAMLFAISPILVTYGSEARGYAPMMLALLTAYWIIDRQLFAAPVRNAPGWLGLATLIGMLAHVSMAFGVAALIIRVAIERKRQLGWRPAIGQTLKLTGRMILAVLVVVLLIVIGASASPEGFRMGIVTAFSWAEFVDALVHMLAFTLGWPIAPGPWLLASLALPMLLWRRPALHDRAPFYLIAIIGLPLTVALLQPANAAIPRYYLLSSAALLLLIADLLAAAMPAIRYAAIPILFAGCLTVDLSMIVNRRADPGGAIRAIEARAPGGATLLIDEDRDSAVLDAAAVSHGYRLRVIRDCASPAYLFVSNNGTEPFPDRASRCGAPFLPIAGDRHYGLSGMAWRLYERAG